MFGENPNESCEEKNPSYPVANKRLRLLSSKEGEHIQYTYEQPKLKKKLIPFHCTGLAKRDSQFLPPGKGRIEPPVALFWSTAHASLFQLNSNI